MAQVLQFKIKAQDQASPTLRRVQGGVDRVAKSTQNLRPILIGAGVAFTALGAAGLKAVQAFAKMEQAQKELNDALQIAGVYSQSYSDRLAKVALELQNLTGISDETIKETQTLLISFGLVGDKLEESTKATIDFAKAQGVDLKAAALLVGKAFAGETGSLSRYGLVIDESIPKTEKFDEVLRQLQSRFGGRAAGAADTLSGQVNIFKEALGDLVEAIGGSILAAINNLGSGIGGLKTIFENVTVFLSGSTEQVLKQQIQVWGELAGVFQFLGDRLPNWLGAKKFQGIAEGLEASQKQFQAALKDVIADEKIVNQLANERYQINVKNVNASAVNAENLKKQKEAAEAALKAEAARVKLQQQKIAQTAGQISSVAGGDLVGALAPYLGPQGAIASAVTQLVVNAKEIPGQISNFIDDLITGLLEGIPQLIQYFSTDFIKDLLTKVVPALVQSLAAQLGEIISAAIASVGSIIGNIPGLIKGSIVGFGKGIVDGVKSIGSSIKSLFGGGDSPMEKLRKTLDSLKDVFTGLSDSLSQAASAIINQALSPEERARGLEDAYNFASFQRFVAIRDLYDALEDNDAEAIAEATQRATEAQIQMMNIQAQAYNAQIEQLDEIMRIEEQKYREERSAIERTIQDLKSWKETAVSAFESVRKAILGNQQSPEQTVAQAKALFEAAPISEKAAAAGTYAQALQQQYQALQSLAGQGAISGEEFLIRQDDILAQLDEAQSQTVSEFDQMISVQEKQLETLDNGFAAFTAAIDKQRAELKAELINIVRILRQSIDPMSTNSGPYVRYPSDPGFSQSFNQNTAGLRSNIQNRLSA